HGQAVYETRARGIDVDGGRPGGADLGLDAAGRRREDVVRGAGAADDEVHLFGRDPGRFQGLLTGRRAEIGAGRAFFGDVALSDARSLADPFVAGVHQLLEIEVGKYFLGQVLPGADDARNLHSPEPSKPSSLPRLRVTRAFAALSAICGLDEGESRAGGDSECPRRPGGQKKFRSLAQSPAVNQTRRGSHRASGKGEELRAVLEVHGVVVVPLAAPDEAVRFEG